LQQHSVGAAVETVGAAVETVGAAVKHNTHCWDWESGSCNKFKRYDPGLQIDSWIYEGDKADEHVILI